MNALENLRIFSIMNALENLRYVVENWLSRKSPNILGKLMIADRGWFVLYIVSTHIQTLYTLVAVSEDDLLSISFQHTYKHYKH